MNLCLLLIRLFLAGSVRLGFRWFENCQQCVYFSIDHIEVICKSNDILVCYLLTKYDLLENGPWLFILHITSDIGLSLYYL